MMLFDPIEERRLLTDDITGYRRLVTRDVPDGAYGAIAWSSLIMAAYCAVVGYDEAARELLIKARERLAVAIETDEVTRAPFSKDAMRADRLLTLVWCNWLLDDVHDAENIALALGYERKDRMEIGTRRGAEFHLGIIEDLNGGLWRQVVDDGALAGVAPPSSPNRVQNEGQMALIYARHALGLGYDAEEVAIARDAFLKRKVNDWLLNGHAIYVAKWTKLFFWRERGLLSAFEVVRKAYDYLPGVTPPEVVAD